MLSEPLNDKSTKAVVSLFATSCRQSRLRHLGIGMKLLANFTVVKGFTNHSTVGVKLKSTLQRAMRSLGTGTRT